MRVIVIYDDTGRKSDVIRDIIGDKGFADVVVKKRHLDRLILLNSLMYCQYMILQVKVM